MIMDCTATSSNPPETSPIGAATSKGRGIPSIKIPDDDPLSRSQVTDDNDIQYAIYQELTKIANCLDAATKHPATEAGPSVITRRRSYGILASHYAWDGDNKRSTLEAAEYDALGQQFTTLVIISTFTATLIIGFLTLAHNTIVSMPSMPRVLYEVGMFFALGGMAIHSGVIIIAGRSAALALKYAKRLPMQAHLADEKRKGKQEQWQHERGSPTSELGAEREPPQHKEALDAQNRTNPPSCSHRCAGTDNSSTDFVTCTHHLFRSSSHKNTPAPTTPCSSVPSIALTEVSQVLHLSDFHRFLTVCEFLQLMGTAIFFLGVMILIFMMFFHRVFPIMLLVGCVSGSCLMSWRIKFWKVSATNQLIMFVKASWRRWMGDKVDGTMSDMGCRENNVDGVKGKRARRWSNARLFGVHWSDTVDAERG